MNTTGSSPPAGVLALTSHAPDDMVSFFGAARAAAFPGL